MNHRTASPAEDISAAYRSAAAVRKDMGISDVTLWRWLKQGKLKAVNIEGRLYVERASLLEFEKRSAAGEFARKNFFSK